MDYIKSVTFSPFSPKGTLTKKETLQSFDLCIERTAANSVIIVPNGLQDNPQSEKINFTSDASYTRQELKDFTEYAAERGISVILKPTVNCRNGTWRAHICFFDEDVPCEPKWGNWFKSYTEFQLHYAEIAEDLGCEMFIAGCEMVQSEKREEEWRRLIGDIKQVYKGPVSYNTDKYQEHNVKWWDVVDVISSSGYYPINDWENQLDRIEMVVEKYNKPFFFAECGCKSARGASLVPNDWSVRGELALDEQAQWYDAMFTACEKRSWVRGFSVWDWYGRLYKEEKALSDDGYSVFGKPAEKVVRDFYGKN